MSRVFDLMFYEPQDEWIVLDDEKWATSRSRFPEDDPRILPWNAPQSELAKATRLRFLVGRSTDFPERIFKGLTMVRELAMPAHWFPSLRPELIPPRLRLLDFLGSHNVKWPKDLVLPDLEYLVHAEGLLQVMPFQVPALRGLTVDVGAKSKMVPLLREWPKLVGLHLVVVNDEKTLSAAPLDRLEYLGIVGGKLDSVKVLADTPMRMLQLKNLAKLTSIAGVDRMPQLEEIDFQYLHHIKDMDLLLKVPRLTKVSFMSCGKTDESKFETYAERNRRRAG